MRRYIIRFGTNRFMTTVEIGKPSEEARMQEHSSFTGSSGRGSLYLESASDYQRSHRLDVSRVITTGEGQSMDHILLASSHVVCQRYNIQFSKLSTIQRKFVTHFRCDRCGLLPVYHINLLHMKRVRCGKCGQLIPFKKKGKYGKLRKEIALQVTRRLKEEVSLIAR